MDEKEEFGRVAPRADVSPAADPRATGGASDAGTGQLRERAHTPTPWLYRADEIVTPRGKLPLVGITTPMTHGAYQDEARANAAFIVRACNSHDKLVVVALKLVARDLDIPGLPFCTLDTAAAIRETLASLFHPNTQEG